jgi:hypothetical protein
MVASRRADRARRKFTAIFEEGVPSSFFDTQAFEDLEKAMSEYAGAGFRDFGTLMQIGKALQAG